MKRYKLSLDSQKEYQIKEVDQYEELTQRKAPYYQQNPKGMLTAYAVCPGCNNPIELIGIIRKSKDERIYGKHCGYHVTGLAFNNVEDYYSCKYRAKQHYVRTQRKSSNSPLGLEILKQIKDQFDRIIYLLKVTTGIQISPNLAEKMLISYLSTKGYYYTGADLRNIPWIFAYQSNSQSLYQVSISKKYEKVKELIQALKHKVKENEDGEIIETIVFSISEAKEFDFSDPQNPLNNILWKSQIQFDYDFYQKLILSKKNEDKRQKSYLSIASKYIR